MITNRQPSPRRLAELFNARTGWVLEKAQREDELIRAGVPEYERRMWALTQDRAEIAMWVNVAEIHDWFNRASP